MTGRSPTTIDRWSRTTWIEETKSMSFFESGLCSFSFSFPSRGTARSRQPSRRGGNDRRRERQRRPSVPVPVAGRSPHPPVWEFNLLPLRDSSEESVRRLLRRDLTGRQFRDGYNRPRFFRERFFFSDGANFSYPTRFDPARRRRGSSRREYDGDVRTGVVCGV